MVSQPRSFLFSNMIKITVITDIHANLLALEAVLKAIQPEGCDALIQTGDVIAIGPYPAECLDLLLSTPRVEHIQGNHETYFVDGLTTDAVKTMTGPHEVQHQVWTHAQLTAAHKAAIAGWPFMIEHEYERVKVAFAHSGLGESGRDIQGISRNAGPAELDGLFAAQDADLVFYGHRHEPSDVQGQARYINPGSLGCSPTAAARYCIVQFSQGHYQVEHRSAVYDDAGLFRAFEERQVPDRELIYRTFFGGRFRSKIDS